VHIPSLLVSPAFGIVPNVIVAFRSLSVARMFGFLGEYDFNDFDGQANKVLNRVAHDAGVGNAQRRVSKPCYFHDPEQGWRKYADEAGSHLVRPSFVAYIDKHTL
jgi:hypothetical protein